MSRSSKSPAIGIVIAAVCLIFASAALFAWWFIGAEPEPWEATALSDASQGDQNCVDEIAAAVDRILRDDELIDVEMNQTVLETLIETGKTDQFVNLYGGDQRRHWTVAMLPEQGCSIYNDSITTIDLASDDRRTRERRRRGRVDPAATAKLQTCQCISLPAQ